MSLLGSLVLLKEQLRKTEALALIHDINTYRLLDSMELSLYNEINRISELEKAKGENVVAKIDTYA
jgi:hypothetical protein